MTQLVHSELRLVKVIQEARDLLGEMRTTNERLTKLMQDLPKSAKAEKAEVMALIQTVVSKISELRKEAHEANQVAGHIEAHYKWKDAIRAIFGQEGVDRCIVWMEYDRENASAQQRDILDDRKQIG